VPPGAKLLSGTLALFQNGKAWNRVPDPEAAAPAGPHELLISHFLQMRAAGFENVDLDDVVVLSGASGLFGFKHGDFMPKYAFLHVGLERRIAEATGFGYEWLELGDVEKAWRIVTESIDAGKPVKGFYVEGILFLGYRDHGDREERLVYGISQEEPGFSKWMTWDEFAEWAKQVRQWKTARLGRYAGRVDARPAAQSARRVLADLVQFSEQPPAQVLSGFRGAAWGLAALDRCAADCADVGTYPAWTLCHDVNSQWPMRKCTAAWLARLAESDCLDAAADEHLRAASRHYRAAFDAWVTAFHRCGWRAPKPEESAKDPKRRTKAAEALKAAAEHERGAIDAIRRALASLPEAPRSGRRATGPACG